jgi:ribonucleoside-triphosphate reductase (thioredoxin)
MSTSLEVLPQVLKRNGQIEDFNKDKIQKGILKSAADADHDINGKFENLIESIINEATVSADSGIIGTDILTNIIKRKLMDYQFHAVAEMFILYSDKQAKSRLQPDVEEMADYVTLTRYSRHAAELGRREVYDEIVDRVETMHLERYPQIQKELKWAFNKVRAKEVLPSMRSMQFGGPAMALNHAKGYNCSFSICNRPRFFAEAFWLLLSGTGTGFSVQFQHIDQLPEVKFIDRKDIDHYIIPDTIEGWADAANKLVESYMTTGKYVEFSYHQIRAQGSALKTSGGKAPGHLPLKIALENVRTVLDEAQGRALNPIECYDMMCMLADSVYAGGIREAAMICLFSLDDGEMMNAKTGSWYAHHPWRARANNSVVLHRHDIKKRQYDRIFKATKQWGEPGFYFTNDEDTGANPCVEIALNPKLGVTPELKMELTKWASKTGRKIPKIRVGQVYWGWQMCNLTEVNASTVESEEELYDRAKAAAIIGTAQAGYTDFPYLGWISEAICNREALLGVSITGIMDSPAIALDPEVQRTAAQIAVETNIEIANLIGIKTAARVTCVKPSGTASIVLGAVGSGIHTHHAKKYFRRIRANPDCPIYKHFKSINPHMCQSVDDRKDLITFPIKAPDAALTRKDLTALEFLKNVLMTQQNWVIPGTTRPSSSPGINHNVSNTITVKEDEWDGVKDFLWKNKKFFSGISMLADTGDKAYVNAPREEVKTEADETHWQSLIQNCKSIDWTMFSEDDDNTTLRSEKACAGGACMI